MSNTVSSRQMDLVIIKDVDVQFVAIGGLFPDDDMSAIVTVIPRKTIR